MFRKKEDKNSKLGYSIYDAFGVTDLIKGKIKGNKNTSGLDLSEINEKLKKDKARLKDYFDSVVEESDKIISKYDNLFTGSTNLQDFVVENKLKNLKSGDLEGAASKNLIDKFKKKSMMDSISGISVNNSFSNVKKIIDTYNNGLEETGLNQDEFRDAVSEGNKGLGQYLKTVNAGTASLGGYIKQQAKAVTASFAMQLATMALNVAIQALITFIITKAVEAYKNFAHAQEIAAEKAEESRTAYENTISELESLEAELEDINEKVESLNQLGVLSVTEQSELTKLKAQNELLNTQLEIKRRLAKYQGKQAADDAREALTTENPKDFWETVWNNASVALGKAFKNTPSYAFDQTPLQLQGYEYTTILDDVEAALSERDTKEKAKLDLLEKQNSLDHNSDTYKKDFDALQSKIDTLDTELTTLDSEIYADLETIGENYLALFDEEGNLRNEEDRALAERIKDILAETGKLQDKEAIAQNFDEGFRSEIEEKLGKLSDEELEVAADLSASAIAVGLEVPDDVYESWENFKTLLDEVMTAKSRVSAVTTDPFTDRISGVEGLSAGLDQLKEIYLDVKDKGDFDYSSILNNEDFKEAFGDLGESYDNFIKTITESPDDISACQSAFNSLATEYINTSGKLEDLTEDERDATVALLEQMGVANAVTIVDEVLAAKEKGLIVTTTDLTDATWDEINALYNEATAGSAAQQAIAQLLLEKWDLNKNPIDTSDDVTQLIDLANAAKVAETELTRLNTLKWAYEVKDKVEANGGVSGVSSYSEYIRAKNIIDNFEFGSFTYEKLDPNDYITTVNPVVTYTPSDSDSGSGSSSSDSDTVLDKFKDSVSNLFDWVEIRLERLQSKTEKYISKAEKYLEDGKYASAGNQYKNALSSVSSEISANQKGEVEYADKANEILNQAISSGLINSSQAKSIKEKIENGTIDITKYGERMQTVIEEYQKWYEKSLDCSGNVQTLLDQYQEYAEALYSLPIEKATAKIEELEDALSLLDTKLEIQDTAEDKNAVIDDMVTNARQQKKTAESAEKAANKNVDSLWRSKALIDALKTNANYGAEKGEKLSTAGLDVNSDAYKAVIKYNEALEAQKQAQQDAEEATLDYTKAVRDYSKQKFDNVAAEYDAKTDYQSSKISLIKAKIDKRTAYGLSETSQKTKGLYQIAIDENNEFIGTKNAELTALQQAYRENKGNMSEEDRLAALAQIKALKEEIISAQIETEDLQTALDNIEITKFENKLASLQADASEYEDNIAYKEATGQEITKEDYKQLISNSKARVSVLKDENEALKDQQKGLSKNSEKYQELQRQIEENEKAIRDAQTAQSEWNKEIANLPIEKLEKTLELLESLGSYSDSYINYKESAGKELTKEDYQNVIDNNTDEIEAKRAERVIMHKRYKKALESKDGTYKGKTADEWLTEYNQLGAEILDLRAENEELYREIDNLSLKTHQNNQAKHQADAERYADIISLKEATGQQVTKKDYQRQIANLDNQIANYGKQIDNYKSQQEGLDKGSDIYQELQRNIEDAENAIRDAEISQAELNAQIANLPIEKIEKELELLDAINSYHEALLDLKKAQGKDLSEQDYLDSIANNEAEMKKKYEELDDIYYYYSEALADESGVHGGKSADEWLTAYNQLKTEILNIETENEKLKDELRDDVYWRDFEKAHEEAQRLSDTLSGLEGLLSDDMLFNSDGELTDFGYSKMAIFIKQLENAREEVKNYSNDIENLNKLLDDEKYTEDEYDEYLEKLSELQNELLSSAQSVQSYTNSIIDLYKNAAQEELDSLFELIDARNEALQAKKDYYDYDKTIRNKTKDIQALQAQIAALEGVETAEAKAKKAQLAADLSDAQEELDDTINEHIFEMSSESLNNMKEVLQEAFDDKFADLPSDLDEIQSLLESAGGIVSSSASAINGNLSKLLEYYGIEPDTTGIDAAYASGTKYVPRKMTALTNENGAEIIVTKDGLITPLERGDGVIPAELTKRLYEMATGEYRVTPNVVVPKFEMPDIANHLESNITQHFDSLITIEGSADAATVADLKALSKDLMEKSYKYTSDKLYNGYIRSGGKRKI